MYTNLSLFYVHLRWNYKDEYGSRLTFFFSIVFQLSFNCIGGQVRSGRQFYQLNEEELEIHDEFHLYLHTKLANPHYAPELHAETTIVNFTVTQSGLEDQLLSLVVRKERKDLADQRSFLIEQNNQYKVKLKFLEDTILQKLADAEGDVTTDVELIESLEDAKQTSNDIKKKMDIAVETEKEINVTSEKYRDVAQRG